MRGFAGIRARDYRDDTFALEGMNRAFSPSPA